MEGDNGRGGVREALLQDDDYYAPPNGNVVIDAENGVSSDDRCRSLKRRISRTVSVPNATSQTALIGAHVSPIESLDYEIAENALLQQEWHAETPLIAVHYIILKWILALVVGVMTGVTAFLINLSVEKITGANLLKTTYYMDQGRIVMACTILFGSNILLVLSSALLCAYIGPAAAGSGIPEVKAYLNGIDAPNILSPRTLLVKILGSIGSVAGGLYVGKEGPLVHTGACFASLLSQGGSTRYHLTWKWLRYFKNDRDRRDLVTCGAAAGVASAFRAPVGGVLFALEEAASWWRSSLLWRAFFATTVVAVMLRYLIALCGSGGLKICGSGGLIMFDIGDIQMDFGLRDLLPATALGVVGGLLGSLFTLINGKVVKTYSFWFNKRGPSAKILQAVILSVVTSACIFGLPWLATCKVCPSSGGNAGECPSKAGSSGKYQQFGCPAGHYNDLAGLLFNTKDNVIRNLFSTGTSGEIQSSSLLIFLVTSFALTVVTYGSALPSGLFVPVIIMGACYGRLTGMLLHSKEFNEGIYAVLGAASFLGGSMRMTVSLCVILLELTNSLPMLPLVMLVVLISKTIGDLFTHSIYDQILQIKALPFLEENPEPYMNQLTAQDVCASPLVTLSGVESVETILQVLKETNHNAFPVLNIQSSPPLLMGIILRDHLLVILKRKAFSPGFKGQLSWVDFAKPGSGKGIRIEDIEELTEEEKQMAVDLRPFTNTSPYTVVDTMSLAKAYSLFRSLGLRHLCVVSTSLELQPIVGLLTRHDFMEEHVLSLYPHLKSSTWKRLRFRPIIMQVAQWGRFRKTE